MPKSLKDIVEKLEKVFSTWGTLKPTKSFGGMTLDEFKKAVQPSYDARSRIAALEGQLITEKNMRDDADKASAAKIQLVINSILGDPSEGPDSALYEAMGYVRKSERKTGLIRKKKQEKPS